MVGEGECRETEKPFQKNYFVVRILMNFMWRPVAGKHTPRNRQALMVYKALQTFFFILFYYDIVICVPNSTKTYINISPCNPLSPSRVSFGDLEINLYSEAQIIAYF